MLEASVLGLKYHRWMADSVDSAATARLKRDYDYSFVVSYGRFDDTDYDVVEKRDVLIDLTAGTESVFSQFSSNCRNHIRKTERTNELQLHRAYEDFDAMYEFHTVCERERGWRPVPPDELRNSTVISVSVDKLLISAMSCYRCGSRLRVGRIFSRRRLASDLNVPTSLFGCAARRIVFELCKDGVELGCEFLDLGGIDPDDPAKAGIAKFKRSFGGRIVPVLVGRFATHRFESMREQIQNAGLDVT